MQVGDTRRIKEEGDRKKKEESKKRDYEVRREDKQY